MPCACGSVKAPTMRCIARFSGRMRPEQLQAPGVSSASSMRHCSRRVFPSTWRLGRSSCCRMIRGAWLGLFLPRVRLFTVFAVASSLTPVGRECWHGWQVCLSDSFSPRTAANSSFWAPLLKPAAPLCGSRPRLLCPSPGRRSLHTGFASQRLRAPLWKHGSPRILRIGNGRTIRVSSTARTPSSIRLTSAWRAPAS